MRILIAAGGSGGHIFPAISLAHEFKKRYKQARILFIVSRRPNDAEIMAKQGYDFKAVPVRQMPAHIGPGYFLFLIDLVRGFIKSVFILAAFRPQVAAGFGGYASGPVLFIAALLGIPTLIHEQNLIPGRANRILARLADKTALSFAGTEQLFKHKPKSITVTGNPVRPEIRDYSSSPARDAALKRFSFEEGNFTILAMGGSQGSQKLNRVFMDALSQIEESERKKLQIIHLTGPQKLQKVPVTFWSFGTFWNYRAFPFLDDMGAAYKAADLVIARAGAGTIFELALFGLPAILIPYAYARGHQMDNAKVLARQGSAIIIREENLTPAYLKDTISVLMRDRNNLKNMSEKARQFARPEAAARLAAEVFLLSKQYDSRYAFH